MTTSQTTTRIRSTILPPFLVMFGVLALWELGVLLFNPPPFILPAPSSILGALFANLGELFLYGFNTFRQAFLGFLVGCGAGIIGAMIVARSETLSAVLLPFAVASNSIPIVAMAPLAIVWFGIDEGSKIAIVAVMCFFPTLVSTVRGLRSASPDALALMHSYAAGSWQIFTKLRIPTALPFVFNAFRVCATLSMIGAIVAEFFGGSVKFLGVYIKTEANILRTTNAWAAIIVACIYGLAFYLAIVALERWVMPWYRETNAE
jgi:NitT/TauT family transport system permease protein